MDLIRARQRSQVPKVGVQSLIGCGAYKSSERIVVVHDRHYPEAATEGEGPSLGRVARVTAGLKQRIDCGSIRDVIKSQGIPLLQGWSSRLFTEGKQGQSPGVAHAGGDAIDGEQSTTKQFAAAVCPTVSVAWRFTDGRLSILISQPSQKRNLKKPQRHDRAVA